MRYDDRTERENLTADETAVSRLLGDLRRVEAPPDFDIKLRARIANASPVQLRPARWVPMMKFAVPLCVLFFIISGFFILNGTFTTDTANEPAASDAGLNQTAPGSFTEPDPADAAPIEPEAAPVQAPVVERAAVTRNERRRSRVRTASAGNAGGGWLDRDVIGSTNTIRLPEISNTGAANTSNPQMNGSNRNDINAAKALSLIGVDAAFDGGELTVHTVRPGSRAEAAGLRAGDVVKTIDNRDVSENASFDPTISARSLSVVREGKTVNISLNEK